MKRIPFFICCLASFAFCLFSDPSSGQAKEPPFHYYPEEYARLRAGNWVEIRVKLDHFLDFTNPDTLSKIKNPGEAGFLMARTAVIDWSPTEKQEVISYLKNFSFRILPGKSFIRDFQNLDLSGVRSINHPLFLPHRAIWTLLQLDPEAAGLYIQSLFKNTFINNGNDYLMRIRAYTIWSMTEKYKSNKVVACLEMAGKMPEITFSPYEKEEVEIIMFKHWLFKLNGQKTAWEYLWEHSGIMETADVFTRKNQFAWYKNILYMQDIYGEADLSALFGILEKTTSPAKRYIFLYTTCFALNAKLSKSQTVVNLELVERTNKMVENLYRDNLPDVSAGPQNSDILAKTSEVMKKYLEK